MAPTVANGEVDFNPEALQQKYNAERDKRLHNGGPTQFRHSRPKDLNDMLKDPYVSPGFKRDPVKAVYDVLIVGAGYTGIQVAARLMTKGYTNICVVEKGGDVGGTWYWNRYPGIQCDIDAYIYMPLLEEMGTIPTRKYVSGKELYEHARNIARKYGINERSLFQTEVTKMTWLDDERLWKIETDRGDDIRARWVLPAHGPLHTPKFPGIPGIDTFQGKSFHSCRWDYSYTGGSPEDPRLVGLGDKRVGIIGTGATGVQIVPRVAEWAKHLYVFQRTPSSVDARNNKDTDSKWASDLQPGWQRERMENFTTIINGGATEIDLVDDGWTDAVRSTPGFFGTGSDDVDNNAVAERLKLADFKKMEYIRRRVEQIVHDATTAEKLKPYYQQFCKRPCFHDDYLQAFNRENVTLVDTDGRGVEAVTPKGMVVNGGQEIELDCIIYATGFDFGGDFSEDNGKVFGRHGLSLSEKWSDKNGGPSTFQGWAIHGFPNMFILGPTQSAPNPNWTHSMMEMGTHFIYVLDECQRRGIEVLEVSPEAERSWVDHVLLKSQARKDFLMQCTPGYYNNEGVVDEKTLRAQPYGGGGLEFNAILAEWRRRNELEGFLIQPAGKIALEATKPLSNGLNGSSNGEDKTSTEVAQSRPLELL
ncbi:hypothetical protein AYO20_03824 [Fonsecaea nubica]|uniref:FAD/NAD(P)-binding domain-containing protein n=1 Tax=Fonsecaea nubica TaxID=856822 RepID=A0A178D3W9_9EURO|nr:hypothetical protein AYO20_03824 [Fonsecaea nubica]OAL36769.1 hypothetical protein AYO20_03824 [Fonsecaea nubica]